MFVRIRRTMKSYRLCLVLLPTFALVVVFHLYGFPPQESMDDTPEVFLIDNLSGSENVKVHTKNKRVERIPKNNRKTKHSQTTVHTLPVHTWDKHDTVVNLEKKFDSPLFFNDSIMEYWIPPPVPNMAIKRPKRILHRGSKRKKLIVIPNGKPWIYRIIQNKSMSKCVYDNCVISSSYGDIPHADAVAFDGGFLPHMPPSRPQGQVWVMYRFETPLHTNDTMLRPQWKGQFNWTMSYHTKSDLFAPIGLFIPKQKLTPPNELLKIAKTKTKMAAWFVSHCGTQSKRMQYVNKLQKIIDVDIYGKCGPLECTRGSDACNKLLTTTYRFYLSFENALCSDYVTEKLYGTYLAPVVPVVRGGADYKRLLPPGTYIDASDYPTPQALGWYLKSLSDDMDKYVDILKRKEEFLILNGGATKHKAFCELCSRLNHPGYKRKTIKDIKRWFEYNSCHEPHDIRYLPGKHTAS